MEQLNDEELIKGIVGGDVKAHRQLRTMMLPSIRKLVGPKGSDHDVLELIAEATHILYEKARADGLQLTSKLKTYLYGVCQRRLWNQRSKKSPSKFNTSEDFDKLKGKEQVQPDTDYAGIEMKVLINKAVMQLGEPCRKLIELYYLAEMSRKEVAQELGYSDTHVSKKSMICLSELKKLLKNSPAFLELFGGTNQLK